MSSYMRERILAANGAQPNWLGSEIPKVGFVPVCSETCRHFDGKRCALLGYKPYRICEPAVERMSEVLDSIEELLR